MNLPQHGPVGAVVSGALIITIMFNPTPDLIDALFGVANAILLPVYAKLAIGNRRKGSESSLMFGIATIAAIASIMNAIVLL